MLGLSCVVYSGGASRNFRMLGDFSSGFVRVSLASVYRRKRLNYCKEPFGSFV